jgi:hypothetical protein
MRTLQCGWYVKKVEIEGNFAILTFEFKFWVNSGENPLRLKVRVIEIQLPRRHRTKVKFNFQIRKAFSGKMEIFALENSNNNNL